MIRLDNLTAPSVTGVAVSSEAGDDDTYAQGETIRVGLTFNAAVDVTGAPRVKLDLSSEAGDEKWAAYASGSGTKMLEFSYTVAEGDASSAGVAVLANTLALNGGTIRLEATSIDADLSHAALGHDPDHKVDGIAPTLSAATVEGSTLTLTFSETLAAAASLANGAFAVEKTPQGGTEGNGEPERDPCHRWRHGEPDPGEWGVERRHGRNRGELHQARLGGRQQAEGRRRQRGGELHRPARDERDQQARGDGGRGDVGCGRGRDLRSWRDRRGDADVQRKRWR